MPYILFTLLDVLRAFPSQVRTYAYKSPALLALFEGQLIWQHLWTGCFGSACQP